MAQYDLTERVDVCIIGSGAGGGTLARELCEKGMKVVLLEAGPRLDPWNDIVNDEFTMARNPNWIWRDPRTGSGTSQTKPPTFICKTVGGTTAHFSGISLRLLENGFKAKSVYGPIAGATLEDWPITLDELVPYYERAERAMGVSGPAGVPMAPLPWNASALVIKRGADKLGWKCHQGFMSINSTQYDGRPVCNQCGFCRQGCRTMAKWSTLYVDIPKAERTGLLDLRPQCMASRINLDSGGLAKSVSYFDPEMNEREQMARVVVLAGNSIEDARLLLNSANSVFPDGLANSSGQVGRNYFRHVTGAIYGQFSKEVQFYKGAAMGGIVTEFAESDPGRGFVGGFQLERLGLGPALTTKCKPRWWGAEFMDFMEHYAFLSGLFIVGEDMPQAKNAITLDPKVKDQYGLPVAHIHFDDHENDGRMRQFALERGVELFQAAADASPGVQLVRSVTRGPYPSGLNLGTLRMGDNPGTSVVNRYGQTHDVKNLFACDGSIFTTGGGENPTLTIVALAMWVGDNLVDQMRKGDV